MKVFKGVFIALTILIVSCESKSTGGDFTRDDVSFTYPEGWSITDSDSLDGAGFYLSLEKSGYDASGLLTITWINGMLDADDYLNIIKDEFKSQEVLDGLDFEMAGEGAFNNKKSLSCEFNFETLGLKHRGIVHVFLEGNKTYSIIRQEALEDSVENKQGFDAIETSFKLANNL